jgi:hypothetical protein
MLSGSNIDVIQEAILDERQIGQGGFGNRIELVDIEYDQITETDTLLLVHPDQFPHTPGWEKIHPITPRINFLPSF